LIQIENACWACNGPIDAFKPIKLKAKEDKVIVEQEISRKTREVSNKDKK